MVRCLLAYSRLPHFLWGELFLAASYLYNRAPHSALNHDTPYKTLHGKDADLRHLRVIGAIAFVYIETHQKKLDPRAWEGRVVGFGQDSLAYRVYHAGSQTVRESRNVIYIETPSVVPAPDFETAFDEGTFAYDEPDDLVRDVRTFLPRKDLGSPSASLTSGDASVLRLFEQLSDETNRDLHDRSAQPSSPGSSPSGESPPSGTPPDDGPTSSLSLIHI